MCVASKVCTRPVSVLTETRSQNRRETRAKRVLKLLYVSHTKENTGTETVFIYILQYFLLRFYITQYSHRETKRLVKSNKGDMLMNR